MTDPNEQTELTEADKKAMNRDLLDAFKEAYPVVEEDE